MVVNNTDFFNLLFEANESFCTGSQYSIAVSDIDQDRVGEFFSVNPILANKDYDWERKPLKRKADIGRRADINVTAFRNFLFEMDNVKLDQQNKILDVLRPYLSTIVFSGSKSLHAVVSLKTPLQVEAHKVDATMMYGFVWTKLAAFLTKKIEDAGFNRPRGNTTFFDAACKNASRLTRTPGFIRGNGNEQKLLYVGSKIDFNVFNINMEIKDKVWIPVLDREDKFEYPPINKQDFMSRAGKGLRNKLESTADWADSAGMYPEIYKLCLWAIDETCVDEKLMFEILEDSVFPTLLRYRYPRYKMSKPVEDAFREKRY